MLKWLVTKKLERGLTNADDIAKELGLPKRWIEKTLRALKSR
jgi:DNA-binding IscR family transcriptional regulator